MSQRWHFPARNLCGNLFAIGCTSGSSRRCLGSKQVTLGGCRQLSTIGVAFLGSVRLRGYSPGLLLKLEEQECSKRHLD